MPKRTAITIAEENLKYLQSLKRGTYSEVINQIIWFMDEKNLTVDQLKEMYWLNQALQNGAISSNIKTQELVRTQNTTEAKEVKIIETKAQEQEAVIKEPKAKESDSVVKETKISDESTNKLVKEMEW